MKKTVLFIFSFLFLTSLAFADNMVSNPGFEDWTAGSPDNWTTAGGAITLTENTTNVHGGTSSCEVTWTATSNQDLISNTFSVTVGATVSGSVWIYDNDPSGRARISVLYTGATNYYGDYSSDQANWQELSFSGTVPTGATAAQFQVRFYDVTPFVAATVLVDDVLYDHPVSGALSISNVSREYTVPTSAQTCYVQCDITGGTAPYTALIKYDVDGVPQTDISMSNTGGDTYQGTIPAQSDGALVEYYIQATDAARATETSSIYGLFWGTSNISTASGDIEEVDGNGVLSYDGYYARVTGEATVSSGVFSTSSLDVYFQDSIGGINIYKGGAGTVTITEGNSYTVFGVIDQYNGKAEIIPNDASTDIIESGSVVIDITILTVAELLAAAEMYEGMLVCIEDLDKVSGTWGANQNLEMNDGTGTIILRIDGDTDLDENSEPVWPKTVTGIIGQYDTSSPYTDGYQTIPRRYTCISDDPCPVVLSTLSAVFANDLLTILWTTQSETNNLGWNIYRGETENALENNTTFCINNSGLIPGAGTTSEPTDYQFTDEYDVTVGQTYWYWLETVDGGGNTDTYGPATLTIPEEEPIPQLPQNTFLCSNYPNPFNPETKIEFSIKEGENGSLSIYNTKGQLLETHQYEAGEHKLTWDAIQYGSGIYFYKLETQSYTETKKMIMLK